MAGTTRGVTEAAPEASAVEAPALAGEPAGGDARTERIVRRLRSVGGHVRGIERMVAEGAYCVDVVNQVLAVQRALSKVSAAVLDRHLHHCVTDAIRGPDPAARERVIAELQQVFEATSKS